MNPGSIPIYISDGKLLSGIMSLYFTQANSAWPSLHG